MSDMDTPEEDQPEVDGVRGSSRVTLMLVALAVVLAGGGWWAYSQFEAQKAAERAQVEGRAAAQRKASQEAKRAAEDAKMAADLQAQKLAADEALRRAQEDRDRVEQELKALQKGRTGRQHP